MPDEAIGRLRRLFAQLAELKRIRRTGWLDRGVPASETESVADHSLLTTLIAWISATSDPELDADRVLKLALVHDLTEAIFGDRPPYDRKDVPAGDPEALRAFFSVRHLRSPEDAIAKREAERSAAAELLAMMPPIARAQIDSLLAEYEAQKTPEAQFVKQVDRLEAFLQSRAYARDFADLPFAGFTDMARREIDHPLLAAIRDDRLDRA
ncbi:MAG: HD domain-containing protein [Thermomicrobiales bacterium]